MKKTKKLIGLLTGTLAAVTLLCFALIPQDGVQASSASGGFEISGGILKSYTGEDRNVVIPSGVSEIGPEAFRGSAIETVTIPGNVRRVGSRAFYDCGNLYRIILQDGVKEIGSSAFASCAKLDKAILPASLQKIEPGAFSYCSSLADLEMASDNTYFFYNDGVLYNHDSTELIQYLAGRKASSFSIPFSVKKVDRYAFWGAQLLTKINLSNNISRIEPYTFANCTGLRSIYLPESVSEIADNAFLGCTNLVYVGTESNSVKTGEDAFKDCNKKLEVNNGVSSQAAADAAGRDSDADVQKAVKKAGRTIPTSTVPGTETIPEIDMSDPNLIGASRIVGGSAMIILSENKVK